MGKVRKVGTGLFGLVALVGLALALVASSGAAQGHRKLVDGTVYDTSCAAACEPECPPIPCGPVPKASRSDIVCAQKSERIIVCPLETSARAVAYPVYSGEGASVTVRRRGAPKVLATLAVTEGHFRVRLGPGEFVLRPHVSGEPCWSGAAAPLKITRKLKGPVAASLDVSDSCVAHPDAK